MEKLSHTRFSEYFSCKMLQSLYYAHIVVNLPQEAMCACVLSHFSRVQLLQPYGLWPARLLCSWDSQGNNTGMGCHTLPHNLCLMHWQVGSLPLASPGKPHRRLYLTASSRFNDPITPLSRGTLQDCEHVLGNTA